MLSLYDHPWGGESEGMFFYNLHGNNDVDTAFEGLWLCKLVNLKETGYETVMSNQGWFCTVKWKSWGSKKVIEWYGWNMHGEISELLVMDGKKKNRIGCKWLLGDLAIAAISEVEFGEEDFSYGYSCMTMKQLVGPVLLVHSYLQEISWLVHSYV